MGIKSLRYALPFLLAPLLLLTSPAAVRADATSFDVRIVGGKLESAPTLRVTQGDSVKITYHSDTELELHLHGYDVEAHVKPGIASMIQIEASAGGRFAVEAHGHGAGGHQTLLYLEVHPR